MTAEVSAIGTNALVINMMTDMAVPVKDDDVSAGGYLALTTAEWGGSCCSSDTCAACPADTDKWM